MNIRKIIGYVAAASLLSIVAPVVEAQRHDQRHARGWHGDIRHFHERDFVRWRSGHWFHGRNGGHLGWWWIVGGVYYFYPQPVYPYPDPYTPPVVIVQPPAVAQAPAPPAGQPQPASGTWYYCDSAQTYYPYVAECPGGWRAVPATPTPPPPR